MLTQRIDVIRMIMDDGEIIREYQSAADKRKQVQVLADLNCVTNTSMAEWLKAHGQKVDKRFLPKPAPTSAPDPDQSAKADAGKPRLTLVPMQIIFDIAAIREYGNRKYPDGGTDNWKRVEAERHFEAFLRHVVKAWSGDHLQTDPESGYLHLYHAACDLAFFLELIAEGE